jgi:hypothetical protein
MHHSPYQRKEDADERGCLGKRKEEIYSLLSLLYSLSFLQAGIQGFTVGNEKCN